MITASSSPPRGAAEDAACSPRACDRHLHLDVVADPCGCRLSFLGRVLRSCNSSSKMPAISEVLGRVPRVFNECYGHDICDCGGKLCDFDKVYQAAAAPVQMFVVLPLRGSFSPPSAAPRASFSSARWVLLAVWLPPPSAHQSVRVHFSRAQVCLACLRLSPPLQLHAHGRSGAARQADRRGHSKGRIIAQMTCFGPLSSYPAEDVVLYRQIEREQAKRAATVVEDAEETGEHLCGEIRYPQRRRSARRSASSR